MAKERVSPIRLTDTETGEVYELDFTRDSVRFADSREFEIETLLKYPTTKVPELFFYAFRKNHKNVSRDKTDKLLDELGGLNPTQLERLVRLFQQVAYTNIISIGDEEDTKNRKVTLEL